MKLQDVREGKRGGTGGKQNLTCLVFLDLLKTEP